MQVKMLETQNGREVNSENVAEIKTFITGETYDIVDAELVEVFLEQKWAEKVSVKVEPVTAGKKGTKKPADDLIE